MTLFIKIQPHVLSEQYKLHTAFSQLTSYIRTLYFANYTQHNVKIYLRPQLLFNFTLIGIWLWFVVFARIFLLFSDALCVSFILVITDKHNKLKFKIR